MRPTKCYYYSSFDLWKNWKRKVKRVHRLVAQAFIKNPNHLSDVCHISEELDENGFISNHVDNLFWWSKSDNQMDKYRKWRDNNPLKKWLVISKKLSESHRAIKIVQMDDCWKKIKIWGCTKEASIHFWVTPSAITSVLKWRTARCRWFIWKYL